MSTTLFGQSIEEKVKRINSLFGMQFSSAALELQRDAKLQQIQNPVKDEFETEAMFEKRKTEAANRATQIRKECDRMIIEARRKFYERIDELKQERDQLLASTEEDAASSFTLGIYDADVQQFPIDLKDTNQSFKISIPLQQARDFKRASSLLQAHGKKRFTYNETYEYYNWKVDFNGQTFAFGPQKGNQKFAAVNSRSSSPPILKGSVKFTEPSGNAKLDANETGAIVVTVSNSGKGAAFGVEVIAKEESGPSISLSSSSYIGEIPAGESRTANLSIQGGADLVDGTATILITYNEANGFAPAGSKITFQTKALIPPKLVLADIGIDDANKNGRIEPGEVVAVTARIQNTGRGDANNVKAKISIGENVFLAGGSQSEFEIGTLGSGKFADVTFSIYTNLQATGVPISLTATESYGKYGIVSQPLSLSFNKQMSPIEEITVNGKEEKYGDIKVAKGLSVDVDVNIPVTKTQNRDAVALIIGISKYKNPDVPSVDYAKHGATIMKEYLISTLGYNEKRILYADDENAGLADFKKLFQKLSNMVKAGKSDVFVYYNGHGAPDTKTNEAFFVPYDCDPTYANETGYPVADFYNQLGKLPAKSITVVIDACFSGSSPKGMLIKGVSPALLRVNNPIEAMENGVVFSSSSENQLSNWYPEKKHGLFTYYFLKALQGEADANKDGILTVEEVQKYLMDNIPDKAREQNHEQTPQVLGDKSKVLVRY